MSFLRSQPSVSGGKAPKGQLRCYQCRRSCQTKDGDWHARKQMQVFLCKTCGVAAAATGPVGRA
jgi:hypothetical protein